MNAPPDEIELDASPTGDEEYRDTFRQRMDGHKENNFKALMAQRASYVESARGIAETWVGFVIVMTIWQFIKPYGMKLEKEEFIAISVSSLAAVVALWWQVGKGFFNSK